MSLLKECDANNRPPESCNKSQQSFGPVRHADAPNSSEVKPDGPWASKVTFVEDFTREHSLPGLQITSIEISGCF
jgi:hypothetical protein